jgi:hypothetical protein
MMSMIMRIVVDLPAPLGPSRPKISPAGTSSVTSSTARNVPKAFTMLRRAIAVAM